MKRSAPIRRTPLQPTAARPRAKRLPTKGRSPERYAAYQALRELLYARARGRCERCGRDFDDTGFECHHRKLRSQGGPDTADNCVALCPPCHRWAHDQPRQAQADGWIVRQRSHPGQVAVVLWDGRTVRFDADGTYDVCWDTRAGEAA